MTTATANTIAGIINQVEMGEADELYILKYITTGARSELAGVERVSVDLNSIEQYEFDTTTGWGMPVPVEEDTETLIYPRLVVEQELALDFWEVSSILEEAEYTETYEALTGGNVVGALEATREAEIEYEHFKARHPEFMRLVHSPETLTAL